MNKNPIKIVLGLTLLIVMLTIINSVLIIKTAEVYKRIASGNNQTVTTG